MCRDQLYFANISLCIFDELAAGFLLDGKFLEPRSDDTLDKLARNLHKQAAGSVQRADGSQMLFMGAEGFRSYCVPKAEARARGSRGDASARSIVAPLKVMIEEDVVVRRCVHAASQCACARCAYTALARAASIREAVMSVTCSAEMKRANARVSELFVPASRLNSLVRAASYAHMVAVVDARGIHQRWR